VNFEATKMVRVAAHATAIVVTGQPLLRLVNVAMIKIHFGVLPTLAAERHSQKKRFRVLITENMNMHDDDGEYAYHDIKNNVSPDLILI